jgi:hypothetical protein
MDGVRRLPVPLPLLVLGVALVVAGLRTGPGVAAAEPPAQPTSFVPPAIAAVVGHPVHVTPRTEAHRARRPHPSHATARPSRPAPVPTPSPAAANASAARPAPPPAAHHTSAPPKRVVSGPTGWPALDAAIARIPTYRAGASRWVVSSKYDFWGTADWYHDVLYVDPGVPESKLYDVAVHEWSHELSVLAYGGDVAAAIRAMNSAFGGHGLTGPERAADCMSILQGADWTHYTTCTDARWRAAAARLVAGKRLS